jgi:hypothetical protein
LVPDSGGNCFAVVAVCARYEKTIKVLSCFCCTSKTDNHAIILTVAELLLTVFYSLILCGQYLLTKKKRGEGKATMETHGMHEFQFRGEELIATLNVLKAAHSEKDRWRR